MQRERLSYTHTHTHTHAHTHKDKKKHKVRLAQPHTHRLLCPNLRRSKVVPVKEDDLTTDGLELARVGPLLPAERVARLGPDWGVVRHRVPRE